MDSTDPCCNGEDEADPGEEVSCGHVVSCSDGAPVFEPAEGTLDEIALSVGDGVERRYGAAVGHGGDHRPGALLGKEGAQVIGVVGLVGDRFVRALAA